MALASTAVNFAAAFAVSAPFLALAYVDFAPDIVFGDPLALAAVQLAIFVLATSRVPAMGAASITVMLWLVHGMALRSIKVPTVGHLRQTFAGGASVTQTSEPIIQPRLRILSPP